MRGLMWVLRVGGGCWFWVFLALGLAALFIDVNVATGRLGFAERVGSSAIMLMLAAPGLAAWILTGRWLAQQPPRRRGFEVSMGETKQPPPPPRN